MRCEVAGDIGPAYNGLDQGRGVGAIAAGGEGAVDNSREVLRRPGSLLGDFDDNGVARKEC